MDLKLKAYWYHRFGLDYYGQALVQFPADRKIEAARFLADSNLPGRVVDDRIVIWTVRAELDLDLLKDWIEKHRVPDDRCEICKKVHEVADVAHSIDRSQPVNLLLPVLGAQQTLPGLPY